MKKPLLFIGITGPSGAGKTTLSKKLAEQLKNIQHIRLDDYYKSPKTFPKN